MIDKGTMYVLVLMKKMIVFMKMPLNDWNMFLGVHY